MKKEAKNKIYRSYLTECLKLIVSNTAKIGGGTVIKKSYNDIIAKIENTEKPELKQNADQIVSKVIARGGLRLIDNTRKEEKE